MAVTPGGRWLWRRHAVLPLLMLATIVALAGCSSSSGDLPDLDAIATPTAPPPPPPPAPVMITPTVEAISIADDDVLTKNTGRLAMDERSITDIATRLITLLQDDLDDRNHGGPGQLGQLATALASRDPAVGQLLEGLADKDNPATTVALLLRLGVDGTPRWAHAELDLERRDGSTSSLSLVVDLSDQWTLVLVGPGPVAT